MRDLPNTELLWREEFSDNEQMGRTHTSVASLAPCIGALELFLCYQKKLCLVGQPGNCLSTWISFLAVAPKQNRVIGRKWPEWLVVCGWGLEAELVGWGEERKGVRTPKCIPNFLFRICLSHKDTHAQMLTCLRLMRCRDDRIPQYWGSLFFQILKLPGKPLNLLDHLWNRWGCRCTWAVLLPQESYVVLPIGCLPESDHHLSLSKGHPPVFAKHGRTLAPELYKAFSGELGGGWEYRGLC